MRTVRLWPDVPQNTYVIIIRNLGKICFNYEQIWWSEKSMLKILMKFKFCRAFIILFITYKISLIQTEYLHHVQIYTLTKIMDPILNNRYKIHHNLESKCHRGSYLLLSIDGFQAWWFQ